ncbi:MAG: beta-N-acetylhexosaminidase [Verrucomicrobiota bacterium]|nr:beta-N-acetylhexosaminidase [Verrucomicrobiota bacterium]
MNTPLLLPVPKTAEFKAHGREVPASWNYEFAKDASPRLIAAVARVLGTHCANGYPLRFKTNTSLSSQAYTLHLDLECGEIVSSDELGAWNALLTLKQLIDQPDGQMALGAISDSPSIAARGVMLDISRCKVPTQATLYQLVDQLVAFKVNEIQLYTEHTFAYAGHEIVWGDASPVTPEQIRALDKYCHDRFVELVPNQNCFGHFERWLRHPEYHHLAESPGGFEFRWGGRSSCGTTLKPDAQSLAFVDGLMKDLLPNFSSDKFNVGCDETWELGLGATRARCEAEGKHHVYLDFLKQIFGLAIKHGRKPQFWADILLEDPELISELPKNVTGMIWGYEASEPFGKHCARFVQTGASFYVCPGTSSWNTIGGRLDNALANLQCAANEGAKHGAAGYLITDWGDGGHHQQLPISQPGFVAGAALAWNPQNFTETLLQNALSHWLYKDKSGNIAKTLFALGRLPNLFAHKPVNRACLNNMLFSTTEGIDGALKHFELSELKTAIETLDAASATLANATPTCTDHALLREELSVTIGLLRHAASRAWHHKQGELARSTALRKELIPLIGRYEACWVARNRTGGLHESSDRLRHVLNKL